MMKPRRLEGREFVRSGDYVDNGWGGFRPYIGPTGHPARHHAYPLYRRRSILVLGHGGHGKGEFCRLLAELYDAECLSSSAAALPRIYPALQAALAVGGYTLYEDEGEAYANRRNCRELWKELISLYNTPDKSTLAREILAKADVYDGMRCREEFEASMHLFDHIVWVTAAKRLGTVDPSMTIEAHDLPDGCYMIGNDGTLDGLRENVRVFGESIGLGPGRDLEVVENVDDSGSGSGA